MPALWCWHHAPRLVWGIPCLRRARSGHDAQVSGRIIIVDDDPFARTMLSSVVQALGFDVVDSVGSFADGLAVSREQSPDVALLDLDLGEGPTGIDLAHAIRRHLPEVGIVFLSTYADPRLLGSVPALPPHSLYLTKQEVADTSVLADALRSVQEEAHAAHSLAREQGLAELTDSQIDVMRLIAAGYSNAEIARRLVIEEASVEKAVMRLIRQLDVRATRAENQRVMIAQAYFAMSGTRVVRRD